MIECLSTEKNSYVQPLSLNQKLFLVLTLSASSTLKCENFILIQYANNSEFFLNFHFHLPSSSNQSKKSKPQRILILQKQVTCFSNYIYLCIICYIYILMYIIYFSSYIFIYIYSFVKVNSCSSVLHIFCCVCSFLFLIFAFFYFVPGPFILTSVVRFFLIYSLTLSFSTFNGEKQINSRSITIYTQHLIYFRCFIFWLINTCLSLCGLPGEELAIRKVGS